MSVLPSSITGRLALLTAALGLMSFVLHTLLMAFLMQPIFQNTTAAISGQVALIRLLVSGHSYAPEAELVQRIAPTRMRVEFQNSPFEELAEDKPLLARPTIDLMRGQLPAGVTLRIPEERFGDTQKTFLFDFEHNGTFWRIHYKLSPPVAFLWASVLGWLTLIALAVSLSLYFGLRSVTRPTSSIAKQIAAQGHAISELHTPAGATSEMQAMVKAFNQLLEEVKSADEKKMRMLAGLSHDLRTPLTRLRLRLETQWMLEESSELIRDISSMQKMIDQFLAYVHGHTRAGLGSDIHVGRQLPLILDAYAEKVRLLRTDTGGSLTLPRLALQRVLTNLIDNALTYGKAPAEVALTARTVGDLSFGVMTVFDRGAGMSEAEFDRAKQPFIRLNESDGIGHTGLGLAIANQIADQLNGALSAVRRADGVFGVEFVWPLIEKPQPPKIARSPETFSPILD
jgi:two-component system, OmpR family, osmolarity sensor histidine kinase EnvZ